MIYAECSNCWPLQMAFMTWSNVVSHYDKRETCTISLSSWSTSATGICDMFHFKLGATPGPFFFLPRVVAVYLCLVCLFSFEVALLLHIKGCTTCYAAMLPCPLLKVLCLDECSVTTRRISDKTSEVRKRESNLQVSNISCCHVRQLQPYTTYSKRAKVHWLSLSTS